MPQPSTTLNNTHIIQGFLSGHTPTILNCYKVLYPSVLSYVLSRSGTEAQAKEVLWAAFEKFRQNCLKQPNLHIKGSAKNYLFGICKFTWLDMITAQKRQKRKEVSATVSSDSTDKGGSLSVFDVLPSSEDNEYQLQVKQTLDLTIKAIQQLSKNCQQLFKLFGNEDKSHKEIAKLLNIEVTASRQRLRKCRQQLKTQLRLLYTTTLQDEPLIKRFVGL